MRTTHSLAVVVFVSRDTTRWGVIGRSFKAKEAVHPTCLEETKRRKDGMGWLLAMRATIRRAPCSRKKENIERSGYQSLVSDPSCGRVAADGGLALLSFSLARRVAPSGQRMHGDEPVCAIQVFETSSWTSSDTY